MQKDAQVGAISMVKSLCKVIRNISKLYLKVLEEKVLSSDYLMPNLLTQDKTLKELVLFVSFL